MPYRDLMRAGRPIHCRARCVKLHVSQFICRDILSYLLNEQSRKRTLRTTAYCTRSSYTFRVGCVTGYAARIGIRKSRTSGGTSFKA